MKRGEVRIGARKMVGDDLGCLFVRPRPGSGAGCVAAVSGSGMAGLRLANRLPYFQRGRHYPDCIVLDSSCWSKGAEGIRAAGFFGVDWGVESGEFVWEE